MDTHMNFMIESCRLNLLTLKHNIHNNSDVYRIHNKEKIISPNDDDDDNDKNKTKQHATKHGVIYGLRRDTYLINGEFKAFHRVFVKCSDSGKYSYLGWVINDDAKVCMICQKDFFGIVTTGKHHCRSCGIVICEKCSVLKVLVCPIEDHGLMRVCTLCFYDQVMSSSCFFFIYDLLLIS